MSAGRGLGLTLIAAGLVLGSLADTLPARVVPRAGDYSVLQGDFHVHSFLGDGGLAPWEFGREARRRGLDVIAITNHNQLLAARVVSRAVRGSGDPIVIVGQEVTASRYHMIAAGITERIDWRQPARAAIEDIQRQGGVAIAAHPVATSWRAGDQDALRRLDGTEAVHPLVFAGPRQRAELVQFHGAAAQRNPAIAPIGSSDFHFGGTLGRCRTFLFVRETTHNGVLDAIRDGRTVASDGEGTYVGDSSLVAMVRSLEGDHPGTRSIGMWSRVAVWSTLFGALVILLVR